MLVKAASVWYLVSLLTGVCTQLVSGGENTFCGAARVGNIVTAVFHDGEKLCFFRRSVAGDSGTQPALTALDTAWEVGTDKDRVLNVCNDVFVMLKYDVSDSKLKAYDPSGMLCSEEFSTGLAGARAVGGVSLDGRVCWFLLEKSDGGQYQCRCAMSEGEDFSAPTLTVGTERLGGSRVIAKNGDAVYAAVDKTAYKLDGETAEVRAVIALPSTVPAALCAMDGATLGELWGGKYILTDGWLLEPDTMKRTALRCDGSAPEACAVQPAAERYFAAVSEGKWYFFDCLLRPVWGMVPYVTAGEIETDTQLKVDTSGFGAMNTL